MKNALLEKPHCRLSNCIGRYSRLSDGSFRCERCDDHVNGDFRPMTDPKLQMARQACASACDDPAWRPEIVAGKCDDWHGVRAALAAIEECTERAAKLAESSDGYNDVSGAKIARLLRSGNHLKGPTDD